MSAVGGDAITGDSLRDTLASARAERDPQRLVALIPYCAFLGISAALEGDGETIRTTMRFSGALIGNPTVPALHGGSIGALLESAAIFQAAWVQEPAAFPRTITLTIDYLRTGEPKDTHARARIAKRGRRVLSVHVEAFQDDPDRPITSAVVHLLVGRDRLPPTVRKTRRNPVFDHEKLAWAWAVQPRSANQPVRLPTTNLRRCAPSP